MLIKYSKITEVPTIHPRSLEKLPLHPGNRTLLVPTATEQHGKERSVVLPRSTVARSHQLKHGRALNNSKHTSQLESAARTYRGKKVSVDANNRNVN